MKYNKKLLFCIVDIIIFIPILIIIFVSLESKEVYYNSMFNTRIENLTLKNYISIFQNINIWVKWKNSIFVTITGVLICLFIAIPFSYRLIQVRGKCKFFILMILLVFLFTPEELTAMTKYRLCIRLNLLNNIFAVTIILAFQYLPMMIFMLYYVFLKIPRSILDAAELEGCNERQKILMIVVPITYGSILIQFLFAVICIWNSLLIPMFLLRDENSKMLMPYIASLDEQIGGNISYKMACVIFASLPIIFLYVILKKQLLKEIEIGNF